MAEVLMGVEQVVERAEGRFSDRTWRLFWLYYTSQDLPDRHLKEANQQP